MKKTRRGKGQPERKDETIRLRVAPSQKATLIEAAFKEGLTLSAWLLQVGLREARA